LIYSYGELASISFLRIYRNKKRDGSFERKKVDVLRMASNENFSQDIMLEAAYTEYVFLVPMMKLIDIEAEEETMEAIEDWQYWKKKNPYM